MGTAALVSAIVSGLLVLLLAVPVHLAFRFQGIEALSGQITIRWLFGLVRGRIQVPGTGKAAPQREPARKRPARAKADSRGRRSNALAVLRQTEFRRRLYRLFTDLVAAAHLRRFRLHLRLGLGDPADTGRLWSLVGPLSAVAGTLRDADVRIEPEFIDAVFEFQTEGRLLLIPLQFLVLAAAFALSPASVRAWRTWNGSHA
jgi:hypothetical protein